MGNPRVGNRQFIASQKVAILVHTSRYVNNNDIVQKYPSWLLFVHGGKLMYINHFGNIRILTYWQRVKDPWRGFISAFKKFQFFDFVSDHGMPKYIKYTSKLEENDK